MVHVHFPDRRTGRDGAVVALLGSLALAAATAALLLGMPDVLHLARAAALPVVIAPL